MVKQYPYKLQVLELIGGGQNEDGDYAPATQEWVNISKCRDESGQGKTVTLSDVTIATYSFLIQCPKGLPALVTGKDIQVIEEGRVRAFGKVLYSRKGQLHTQIWLS